MCISCAQNGIVIAETVGLDLPATKLISISSAVILLFAVSVPMTKPATNVAAGAACIKANQKVVKGGKVFICKKSGKTLKWKVKTKKPLKPIALPVPTPSSSKRPGEPCVTVGQRENNVDGYLECREVANKVKKYFQLSDSPKSPPLSDSPESLDVCRIPDQSNPELLPQGYIRSEGPVLAYPVPSGKQFAKIPRTGQINALIIPIDFPDTPGSGSPSSLSNEMIEKTNEWMRWYSQGKSYYKFQTHDKWIRAPKDSAAYVPNSRTSPVPANALNFKTSPERDKFEIASEYLDLAKDHFDYKDAHSIFFLYPRDVKIWSEFWGLGINNPTRGWYTTYDPRLINVWVHSSSARQTYYNFPIWAFFLHENLHNQGLQGHAPNNGYNFGIMTNQYGMSLPLSSWDALVIDWQFKNQFYCVQRENLKPTSLVMSPMEREEIGTKAIMIKLSKSQILVIESRRKDKWSSGYKGFPGLPDGFYGVIVYKVDTSSNGPFSVIEPDGPNWRDSSTSYAYLIRNLEVDHGYISGAPQSQPIDMNFVMYEGESLTTNGIKISLIKSGDHDEVRIERVSPGGN